MFDYSLSHVLFSVLLLFFIYYFIENSDEDYLAFLLTENDLEIISDELLLYE